MVVLLNSQPGRHCRFVVARIGNPENTWSECESYHEKREIRNQKAEMKSRRSFTTLLPLRFEKCG
jgi:hypothetical protein